MDLINDPNVDSIVELIGGTTIANDIAINTLKAKRIL